MDNMGIPIKLAGVQGLKEGDPATITPMIEDVYRRLAKDDKPRECSSMFGMLSHRLRRILGR